MIYTIGFTRTTAQHFFERLRHNEVQVVLDIRLNNRSQLAGFARYPDIGWFLEQLCGIEYIYDDFFAPSEDILKAYRRHEIDWAGYEERFEALMDARRIEAYIRDRYAPLRQKALCLLCSEPDAQQCHRRLVAAHFAGVFACDVKHI